MAAARHSILGYHPQSLDHLESVSEGHEINSYRSRTFKPEGFVDFDVSPCFVHLRKPDMDTFRVAPDIAQVPVSQIVYIENNQVFVEIAEGLGIRGILHTDYKSACKQATARGLEIAE